MTTVNEDTGRILWSTESKYYLLRLIKENFVIISPDVSAETMNKKEEAWKVIEENFIADGMQCQLGKLKRLWKRMKDTARQNLIKYNEQKKRGLKNIKVPSELDMEVAELIAIRNMNKNKARKSKAKHSNVLKSRSAAAAAALFLKTKREEDAALAAEQQVQSDDMSDSNDYVYYNNNGRGRQEQQQHHQQQQQQQQQNGYHDALEPVTILEELENKPTIVNVESFANQFKREMMESLDSNDNDEDDNEELEEREIQRRGGQLLENDQDDVNMLPTYNNQETISLQKELLTQQIKLQEIQRQNEEEKINYERQIYQKKSLLLDLQIKKANLELKRFQQLQHSSRE